MQEKEKIEQPKFILVFDDHIDNWTVETCVYLPKNKDELLTYINQLTEQNVRAERERSVILHCFELKNKVEFETVEIVKQLKIK